MAKRARKKGRSDGRRRAPPPPPRLLGPEWRTLAIAIVVFLIVAISAFAVLTGSFDDDDNGGGNGDNGTNGGNGSGTEAAPNFVVSTIDGEPVALDQFRGKVVVLDLMATWCTPCSRQMDDLNLIQAEYPRSKVVILSIGVDASETDQQLRDFRDQHYADWRFARDTDDVGTKYDAQSIPTLAIIDKRGNLEWTHSGATTFEDLKARIDPLL